MQVHYQDGKSEVGRPEILNLFKSILHPVNRALVGILLLLSNRKEIVICIESSTCFC